MAIVYNKDGKQVKCGNDDAAILIKSGKFTAEKPKQENNKKAK